ncbi:MAG: 2-succinyl-5-enolpyruvyl-6-hydroxy-3-cyclohexene-1-carboxylic-acid synthase [Opitutaceae bacterium]|nr:2-succinyl-5-enolpyruvyl-6-hydroxy-3-cyclohexene-1-carboxylic-acid synthase [Opitutaceae bacterium]
MPAVDSRNTNALWCSVLAETLVRSGLRHAVISPGSRSTPLTFALVRHPGLECVPVVDERSAAFFALGLAKRTHRPVVLLCTSGTAGANYLPAVIEARESGTPLLVVTADRPPEMRDCMSGQTIDQQKLFGAFVAHFHEFAVPEARLPMLQYARQTLAHAVQRTLVPHGGPVHLNMPFRDPLPPIEDASAHDVARAIDEAFFEHLRPVVPPAPAATVWQRPTTTRGLIVAGPASPPDAAGYVRAVQALATGLGWPILADALSPLRHHTADAAAVVAHYDVILRHEPTARDLAPRHVLCLEAWPTSKVLRGWLEESGAEITLVAATADNRDALHGRTRHLPWPPEALAAEGIPAAEAGYREAWVRADRSVAEALRAGLEADAPEGFFEPVAGWTLAHALPDETTVFVASSMPVRDVEYFWPHSTRRHRFVFNRGANGIDGTLSTALGVAHGGGAAVLLCGDLAFLHDSNGLLLARHLRGSLTVVLINNRGGGIFGHLPVAQFDPPFEEYFATPQSVDFAHLCAAHGVPHVRVRDRGHLHALVSASPDAGVRVLEVRTDRKRDVATRRRLLAAASGAAGGEAVRPSHESRLKKS